MVNQNNNNSIEISNLMNLNSNKESIKNNENTHMSQETLSTTSHLIK